jgi:hypothetical protein
MQWAMSVWLQLCCISKCLGHNSKGRLVQIAPPQPTFRLLTFKNFQSLTFRDKDWRGIDFHSPALLRSFSVIESVFVGSMLPIEICRPPASQNKLLQDPSERARISNIFFSAVTSISANHPPRNHPNCHIVSSKLLRSTNYRILGIHGVMTRVIDEKYQSAASLSTSPP